MQITNRDIYKKTIQVIRSCDSIYHIEAATRYVNLAIKQIRHNGNTSMSIDLMISNLKYYLRMKRKAM